MASKETYGGSVCPQFTVLYADKCKKCKKHVVAVNDIRVYEGCQCLSPDLDPGMAHTIETSKIVDALGLKPDQRQEAGGQ